MRAIENWDICLGASSELSGGEEMADSWSGINQKKISLTGSLIKLLKIILVKVGTQLQG